MPNPLLRVVSLFAALLLAVGTGAVMAQDELFVTNGGGDSVTVYSRTANGNIAPLRTISGAATGLSTPRGLAVDTVNNELAVANAGSGGNGSITVYPLAANGNVAPLRTISFTTVSNITVGLAVDTVNNELLVGIGIPTNSVLVFARTANGNVAPLRTISGAATGLNGPYGVAVDTVNNEVAVTNLSGNSVTVYARTANGNVAPLRTISGAATGLNSPTGDAVDTVNNELVVSNLGGTSVTVFARTANGNVAPLRTISGAATGLNSPIGNAVDTVNDELAVVNEVVGIGNSSVTVYARTANGNVAPLRTLQGAATGFNIPLFVGVTTGGVAPTPTATPTSPPGTPTPTPTPTPTSPPGPTSTPLPGGVVVPTLDVRGQIALMLILAAIGILAIRRMSS